MTIPSPEEMKPLANQAALLLKALAHPARLMICCQLRDQEMAVSDIEHALDIQQPRLSRELSKLRELGILKTRRVSKVVFYSLGSEKAKTIIDSLCTIMLSEENDTKVADANLSGAHQTPGIFADSSDQP